VFQQCVVQTTRSNGTHALNALQAGVTKTNDIANGYVVIEGVLTHFLLQAR